MTTQEQIDPCRVNPHAYSHCAGHGQAPVNVVGLTAAQNAALGGVGLFAFIFSLLLVFGLYSCHRAKREDLEEAAGVSDLGAWRDGLSKVEKGRALPTRSGRSPPGAPEAAAKTKPMSLPDRGGRGRKTSSRARKGIGEAPQAQKVKGYLRKQGGGQIPKRVTPQSHVSGQVSSASKPTSKLRAKR